MSGGLKFEHRNDRLTNLTSLGTISNVMDDAVVIDDAGQVYDRFQVKITPRRVGNSNMILATLDYHIKLKTGQENQFTLNYVEQTSGTRLSGVIIPPEISTDYKFGSANNGTSEDLNTDLAVTMVRTGANSSDIKVKNNGAGTGYLNLFQLRGLGIYSYNPYTVEAGTGGLRVESLEMPYQNNPDTAKAIADYLQSVSSDNARRACRVKFLANKSEELMTAAMTGNISTRWTIQETQTGINGDFFINSRKHTVSLGNRLDVEWLMVPAGAVAIWIMDEGEETTHLTISTNSDDCHGVDDSFSKTEELLAIGNLSTDDSPAKAWIPFIVPVAQYTTILSAILKVRAHITRTGHTVKVKIGCEAADDPSAPSSWSDLNARVLSSAYIADNNVPAWTAGHEYIWDITDSVQEIVNRAGFASGNTIAVMINDNGSTPDKDRQIASDENTSYAAPILDIFVQG